MYGTSDGIQIHDEIHPEAPRLRGQFDRRERRTENSAIRTTQYSSVRSVTRTTVYTPGSLAGARASARSGPQTVAQRGAALPAHALAARSLVAPTAGPTPSTLGALRPACRRPGRTACRSRGTWVRGDSKSRSHAAPRYGRGSGTRRELAKYRHESQSWVAK